MGPGSAAMVGRNVALNAAGTTVGAITWKQNNVTYTNNNNTTLKPYVAVP